MFGEGRGRLVGAGSDIPHPPNHPQPPAACAGLPAHCGCGHSPPPGSLNPFPPHAQALLFQSPRPPACAGWPARCGCGHSPPPPPQMQPHPPKNTQNPPACAGWPAPCGCGLSPPPARSSRWAQPPGGGGRCPGGRGWGPLGVFWRGKGLLEGCFGGSWTSRRSGMGTFCWASGVGGCGFGVLFKGDVGSEELVASPVGTRTLRKPRVAAGRSPRSLSPPPPFINPTPHCSYPPRLLAMHCRKLVSRPHPPFTASTHY